MWAALPWILRTLGIASIGYFANDLAEGVGSVTGVGKDESTGRPKWWIVVIAITLAAGLLYSVIKFFNPKYVKA